MKRISKILLCLFFFSNQQALASFTKIDADYFYQDLLLFYNPPYKEKLDVKTNIQFVRALYLSSSLNIVDHDTTTKNPDRLHLIINNRNGVVFGNLSVVWEDRTYSYYFGDLELYKWTHIDGKNIYQLEWTTGTDSLGIHKVRLIFIEPNLNEEVSFYGIYLDFSKYDFIRFIGSRDKRSELN